MKISKTHTVWIIFKSALYTAYMCGRAAFRGMKKSITRPWIDKTAQIWSGKLLDFVGVTYEVINPHHTEPKPGKAYILMCNHSSLYDIPLSFKAFPKHSIRMLAKKELKNIPFMGKGMVAAEFPFIDRKNRTQAIKDLAYAQTLLESGIMMWIAPEGTRSKDGRLAPFKKGAFVLAIQAKATIIPIGIRGAYDILPARTFQLHTHQHAEIHIGEAVDASTYTLDERDALLTKVHAQMNALVGQSE